MAIFNILSILLVISFKVNLFNHICCRLKLNLVWRLSRRDWPMHWLWTLSSLLHLRWFHYYYNCIGKLSLLYIDFHNHNQNYILVKIYQRSSYCEGCFFVCFMVTFRSCSFSYSRSIIFFFRCLFSLNLLKMTILSFDILSSLFETLYSIVSSDLMIRFSCSDILSTTS